MKTTSSNDTLKEHNTKRKSVNNINLKKEEIVA